MDKNIKTTGNVFNQVVINKNFTKIPNEIILDKTLSPDDKLVYIFISSVSKSYNLSYKSISLSLNMTEKTVMKSLGKLQEQDYLKIEKVNIKGKFIYQYFLKSKNSNIDIVDDTPLTEYPKTEASISDASKTEASIYEYSENDYYTNTNINKTNKNNIELIKTEEKNTKEQRGNTLNNIGSNSAEKTLAAKTAAAEEIKNISRKDLLEAYENIELIKAPVKTQSKLYEIEQRLINDFSFNFQETNSLLKIAKNNQVTEETIKQIIDIAYENRNWLETGKYIGGCFKFNKVLDLTTESKQKKEEYFKNLETQFTSKFKSLYSVINQEICGSLTFNNLPNIVLNALYDTKIFFECDYTKDDINYQNKLTDTLKNSIDKNDLLIQLEKIITGEQKHLKQSYEFKQMFFDCSNDEEIRAKLNDKLEYLYF